VEIAPQMSTLPSIALPVFIVLAVGFIGAITAFVRDRRRFSGYRNLTPDVLKLGKLLKGEVFRDGDDLVASGVWKRLPAQVRFSHAEYTPGVNIRLGAPAGFGLFIAPRSAQATEGRFVIRTSDEMLNARVEARSDHPTHARMLLGGRDVVTALNKLCRSSNNLVRVTRGMAEFIDLTPPTPESVRFASVQLEALGVLAQRIAEMPGAEDVKVEPLARERRYFVKATIAVGVIAALAAVLIVWNGGGQKRMPIAHASNIPDGISPTDLGQIPGVTRWRLATAANFGDDGVAWLRSNQLDIAGRIPGDFAGNGKGDGVAYVLTGANGERRIVILSGGRNAYDAIFQYIGAAARFPKSLLKTIEWAGTPPSGVDGDGLLIIRAPNDPSSGLIIFLQGSRIITAVPKDYLNIRLE